MRAMQLISPKPIENAPLEIRDVPIREPSENDLLIRVRACGVCHTDLHIVEGELPQKKSPLTPGHQIIGEVEKVGLNVINHRVGDRVGVAWLHWACGLCEYCISAQENLCTNATFTGYDVDGGYADYVAAPSAFVYPIPKHYSDEAAAPLLCAGIIGFRALRMSSLKPGERLGLFGFGASAHIALQVARHWGCDTYAFSRNVHHRKLAEELGAAWTGLTDSVPPHLLHSAISFAPVGDIVPKALGVLRKGGTLALAGITMTPIPSFEYSLLYHERTIRSVANSTRQDAMDFLRIAAEIPVKTRVEVFPLADANRALQLLKGSTIDGGAVLQVSS